MYCVFLPNGIQVEYSPETIATWKARYTTRKPKRIQTGFLLPKTTTATRTEKDPQNSFYQKTLIAKKNPQTILTTTFKRALTANTTVSAPRAE